MKRKREEESERLVEETAMASTVRRQRDKGLEEMDGRGLEVIG